MIIADMALVSLRSPSAREQLVDEAKQKVEALRRQVDELNLLLG